MADSAGAPPASSSSSASSSSGPSPSTSKGYKKHYNPRMNPNSKPYYPGSSNASLRLPTPKPKTKPVAPSDPSTSISSASDSSSVPATEGPKTKPKPKARMPPRSKVKAQPKSGSTAPSPSSKKKIELDPDFTPLSVQITQKLLNNCYECLICFENLGRSAVIWNCRNCSAIFHISCIKKWCASSINENKPWLCPGCRVPHSEKPTSSCFCGKSPDPSFNPYLIPHSCGELCKRMREGTDCPHPCNLICHPGPCPPCSGIGEPKSCYCAKTKFPIRCGEIFKGRSCGEPCNKIRSCGLHFCDEPCHPGSCKDCQIKFKQICYCGKKQEDRFCGSGQLDTEGEGTFSCDDICDRPLSCGNHKCQETCHIGPCKPCVTDPKLVQQCACGKKDAQTLVGAPRKSCLDPIPLCSSVCAKLLECGIHMCENKCHHGPCPPCQIKIDVVCRCSSEKLKRVCSTVNPSKKAVCCDKKCDTLKNCNRHRCTSKCCPAFRDPNDPEGLHICRLTCGRKMNCGVHKCELLCHKGKCPPCNMASYLSLRCRCGKTIRNPPIPCGDTNIPECPHPCNREHACDHPVTHNCHNNEECVPCVVLVSKLCMGQHEVRNNVPCYLKEVSCGKPCDKTLSCGVHVCKRICHSGPCEPNASEPRDPNARFTSCGLVCGKELQACEHKCKAICHPGTPCPNVQCREPKIIKCACGRTSGTVMCGRGGPAYEPFSIDDRVWPCDDLCEQEKRNKILAQALGVNKPTKIPPPYSPLLLSQATAPLIKKIEQVFAKLINDPAAKTYSFPPMIAQNRQLVHELAFFYSLDSASYDAEPKRNVVVSKRRDSKIPAVLLSEMTPSLLQLTSSVEVSLQEWAKGKPCIHIYELSPAIKTQHIAAMFRDYSVQIRWLDDTNALVVFPDENTLRTAINSHTNPSYKFKFYPDIALFDITPFKAHHPLALKPSSFKGAQQSGPSNKLDLWSKNDDFIKALKKKEAESGDWDGVDPRDASSVLSRFSATTNDTEEETPEEVKPEEPQKLNFSVENWSELADSDDDEDVAKDEFSTTD